MAPSPIPPLLTVEDGPAWAANNAQAQGSSVRGLDFPVPAALSSFNFSENQLSS